MAEQKPAQPNTRKRTRNRVVMPRKAIQTVINLKSATIAERVVSTMERFKVSTSRVAGLYVLTTSNTEIRDRLESWFSGEIAEVERRCELLNKMRELEVQELGGKAANYDILTPELYSVNIEVEHPVFWRVINAIKSIDTATSSIENMWLAGEVDDKTNQHARGVAFRAYTHFLGRLRYVATKSANRAGGIYDLAEYEEIMATINTRNDNAKESDASENDAEEMLVVNA